MYPLTPPMESWYYLAIWPHSYDYYPPHRTPGPCAEGVILNKILPILFNFLFYESDGPIALPMNHGVPLAPKHCVRTRRVNPKRVYGGGTGMAPADGGGPKLPS